MAATGEYFGTVKSYSDRKGWGFIECPETQQLYGKDILFQKCELPSPVQKGDQLSFSVTPGRNGVLAVGLHVLSKAEPPAEERSGSAEGSYVGTIKSFSPQNGWGFIECAETQQLYGKDILVLKEELHGVTVMQGQQVTFSVTQGRKGPLATALQFALKGGSVAGGGGSLHGAQGWPTVRATQSYQQFGGQADGSFVGVLKSFNPQKGWGFIECRETHAIYAKDILVLKAELAATPATPGLRLSFAVTQGRTGPIAVNVRMLGSAAGSQVRPAVAAMPRKPAMQALQANPMVQGLLAGGTGGGHVPLLSVARGPETQEHICGSIKSFDEQKGWGFVTGGPILQLYGKDIFVSKASLQGQTVAPGDQVMIKVEMGLKGPMAADGVKVLPHGSFVAEGVPGTLYTGTVKSFNADKGWGFVTSEETVQVFSKDLFLHKRELGDLVPASGDQVQFTVQLSTGGRPEATNVMPVGSYTPVLTKAAGLAVRSEPF